VIKFDRCLIVRPLPSMRIISLIIRFLLLLHVSITFSSLLTLQHTQMLKLPSGNEIPLMVSHLTQPWLHLITNQRKDFGTGPSVYCRSINRAVSYHYWAVHPPQWAGAGARSLVLQGFSQIPIGHFIVHCCLLYSGSRKVIHHDRVTKFLKRRC
jgi:hypothetical protein